MTQLKSLGKKPPHSIEEGEVIAWCQKWDSCLECFQHYRQALLEAAEELENKNVVFPDRMSLSDWNLNLAKKLRISAGVEEE